VSLAGLAVASALLVSSSPEGHILTHTSGLPDYEDLMAAAEKGRAPNDEVLALLRGEARGRFAPGTSWAYSNSGYVANVWLVGAR